MHLITRFSVVAAAILFLHSGFNRAFGQSEFPTSNDPTYSGGGMTAALNATQDSVILTAEVFYNCPASVAFPASLIVNVNCGVTQVVIPKVTDEEITDVCAATFPECGSGDVGERRVVYTGAIALSTFSGCNPAQFRFNPYNRVDAENLSNPTATADRLRVIMDIYFTNDSLNTLPSFAANGQPFFCGNSAVSFDPQVSEPDGDSLVFSFRQPQRGIASPINISYAAGYSLGDPLNNGITIDSETGILDFTAPNHGLYQLVIRVDEYDRTTGNQISMSYRDFQIRVDSACSNDGPAVAASFSGTTNVVSSSGNDTVVLDTGVAASWSLVFTGDAGETVSLTTTAESALNGASASSSASGTSATHTVNWTPGAADLGMHIYSIAAEDNACDISGKTAQKVVVIVQGGAAPGPFQVDSITFSPMSCASPPNGTITVHYSGGNGPYTFSVFGIILNQTDTNSTGVFTGLINDFYDVYAIDSSSLIDTFISPINVNPNALSINSVSTQNLISCDDACDGAMTVNHSGGNSPFTYSWSQGQTSKVVTGLCGGNVAVTVTDNNGCSVDTVAGLFEPPAIFGVVDSTDSVTCNGGNDGQAFISGHGGTVSSSSTNFYLIDESEGTFEPYPTTRPVNSGLYQQVSLTDESLSGAINIGFNFSFFGNTKTQFRLHGNGFITFQSSVPGANWVQSAIPSTAAQEDWIGLWEDLNPGAGGRVETYRLGSSPNRVRVVNYIDVPHFTTGQLFSFQYVLYESSNIIQVFMIDVPVATTTAFDGGIKVLGIENLAGDTAYSPTGMNGVNFGATNTYVAFIPGSQNFTYSWSSIGSGSSATNLTAGNYTVTVQDGSCTDTVQFTIAEPPVIVIDTTLTPPTCVGDADGSITASATGGNGGPFSYMWSTGGTSATITNLPAGTYTVTATDVEGCTESLTVILTDPDPVVAAINVDNNVSCFGGSDGQLTASGSGGSPGFTFLWNTTATTATISGLTAGTYSVTVTDASGCTDSTSATVTEPATPLAITINSVTDVSCVGGNDGSITANAATGGTGPYTYLWNTGATNLTINSLTAGTYTITATDAEGCTAIVDTTVSEPASGVTVSIASATGVSCNGDSDGSITANAATGGTSPYTYLWSTGATTLTVNSLAAGTYTITATDAGGCETTADTTITEPALLTIDTTSVNQPTCSGSSNGSITVAGSGGTSPYSYQWSTGATTATISGLTAGTYTATVTDNNACQDDITIVLTNGGSITAAIAIGQQILCNGDNNGQLTASGSGGTSPYTFLWTTSATTATINGLGAGTYGVTVTDNNGCSDSTDVTLTEPTALDASIASSTDVSCLGGNDGSATASASGGSPGYSYSWSTGDTTITASSLSAGNYTVTVTDDNGCTDTAQVTITQPATGITVTFTSTNVQCFGQSNGSATASGSGGTTPYSFSWSTGGSSATISGLSAGVYTVTITDVNGCQGIDSVEITAPAAQLLVFTSTDSVSCFGASDGQIQAFGFGGTPGYSFLWNTGATTATITNLPVGTYTVTITDANGCTDSETDVLSGPTAISLSFNSTDPSCPGNSDGGASVSPSGGDSPYSYLWSTGATTDSISNLVEGTYTVTVTDGNNCQAIDSVTLVDGAGVVADIVFLQDPSCAGDSTGSVAGDVIGGTLPFTYTWNIGTGNLQTGLPAGTYTLTVTDGAGCQDDTTVTLVDPPALTVSIIDSTNPTCAGNDGEAEALASGGTSPITYAWSSGGNAALETGLGAGTFTVVVTDNFSCTDSALVTLIAPPGLTATGSALADESCAGNDGQATVNIAGGTTPFSFSWSTGGTTQTITGLVAGVYTVTVTDDNNCTDTAQVTIADACLCNWTASAFVVSNVDCNGDSTGVAAVIDTGAAAPVTYLWSDGSTNDTLTGVPAGTYTVTVTDNNGCADTTDVTITEPGAITFNGFSGISDPSCDDACDGAGTASASGGTGTLTYAWSSGSTAASATGLCGGGHTVTVTDGNGCSITEILALFEPPSIFGVVDSTSDALCAGDSSGSAFISGYGGTVAPTSTAAYIIDQTEGEFEPYPKGQPWNATGYQSFNLNDDANTDSIQIFNGGSFSFFGQTKTKFVISSQGLITFNLSQLNTGQVNGMYSSTSAIPFNGTQQDPRDFIGAYWHDLDPSTSPNTVIETYVIGTAPDRVRVVNYTMIDHFAATPPNIFSTFQIALYETSNIIQIHSDSLRSDGGGHVQGIENAAENQAYAVPGRNNTSFEADNDYVAFIPTTQNFNYTWSSIGSGPSSTNLVAGNYTVTIADGACTDTVQFTIGEPGTGVSASIVSTSSPTCFGGNDGFAVASGTGGTTPYSFAWSSGSTQDSATNLTAGTYTVTVTDANGCEATADTTLGDGAVITVSMDSVPSFCFVCSGQATATVSGATTPITYVWSTTTSVTTNSTSHTITSLCSGPYSVTVTDANGCSTSNSIVVGDLFTPPFTTTKTAPSCDGVCDGQIVATYNCGTCQPFRWYSGVDTTNLIGTGDTITGLCAGTYLGRLTTSFNCNRYDTVIITSPSPLALTMDSNEAGCSGGSGSAMVSVSGGTSPYSYLWNTGDTLDSIGGLAAGTYTVTVTDANGCMDTGQVSVISPTNLVATALWITDALCNGSPTGSAYATQTGGSSPFTYTWSTGATNDTIFNLIAGIYTVTVTDANGCTATDTVGIDQPDSISIAFTETPVSCGGAGNDGELEASASGGTPGYSYAWSNGGSSATITNLVPGTYCVTVTDGNGCLDSACYALDPPGGFTVAIVDSADVLCFGDNNGYAVVQVQAGGSGTYTYAWDNGATTDTVNNLSPGLHTVTVTDGVTGCIDSAGVTIATPTQLVASVDSTVNNLCFNGTEGMAFGSASGGTPPYSFVWSNGDNGTTADSLPAGVVTLTVTDANGCTATDTATITEPATGLSASVSITSTPLCSGDSATVQASGSGGSGSYNFLWPNGQTTATVMLPAGSYCVTVNDGGACEDTACVTIVDPSPVTASATITQPTCPGGNDGQLSGIGSGGTPGYTYAWSLPSTNQTITGLSAGTYTLTVTDANGCEGVSTIILTDPAGMSASFSNINTSACGTCNGSATVTIAGGTAPYSYLWTSGSTGTTGTSLCSGLNEVIVTDDNNCTDTFSVAIPSLGADTVTAGVLTNASCNGGSDGSGFATYTCTVAPCTVEWYDVNTSTLQGTTDTITGLPAGDYYVQLTNDSACISFDTITITEPSPVVATITSSIDVSCIGGNDGSASVSGSGGTPGYSFAWPSGGTGATETGLSAGTYCVTVTDNNGCEDTACVNIQEPATGISVTAIVLSNVTCNGGSDGAVTATATGGSGNYTFTWNSTFVTDTLTGITAGAYIVVVDDGGPCTATDTAFVTEPTAVGGVISNVVDPSCAGLADGSAMVTGSGGTPGYTYLWPSGNTTQTETGLASGTYCVTISDASGCQDTACVTITDPPAITNTFTGITTSNCTVCDGNATANPAGGSGSTYSFLWDNGQTTAANDSLCAGINSVTITDSAGCFIVANVPINADSADTVFAGGIDATCGNCDGVVFATYNCTSAPCTVEWTDLGNSTVIGTTDTIDSLCAGVYAVELTNAQGCVSTDVISIIAPDPIDPNETISDVSCFGSCDGSIALSPLGGSGSFNYAWNNGSTSATNAGLCAGTYTVTISDGAGCDTIATFNVDEPTEILANASITNASCAGVCDGQVLVSPGGGAGGYSFNWNPVPANGNGLSLADSLCAGTHILTITDANGCVSVDTFEITEPDAIVQDTVTITDATCGQCDGAIDPGFSGGAGGFTFAWSNGETTNAIDTLCFGFYEVTVTDADGCFEVFGFPVSETDGPVINITSTNATASSVCDGTATVNVITSLGTVTYSWSNGDTSQTADSLCAGLYIVTVTDTNGCSTVDTVTITEPSALTLDFVIGEISCTGGGCDGSIEAVVNGGVIPYTYLWSTGDTTSIINNLCAGTYTVTVTDANGQMMIDSAILNDPQPFTIVSAANNVSCPGECDGNISLTISGGAPPYSILWNTGDTTANLVDLCGGNYSVTITDTSGCSDSLTFVITEPVAITITIDSMTNPDCQQGNGSISVTATGGNGGPYSYLWLDVSGNPLVPTQATSTASNLVAGIYNVKVTDLNGCIDTHTVILNNLNAPVITLDQIVHVSCFGECDGAIFTSISGGTTPYNILWSNGATTDDVDSLCAGNDTIAVVDANLCLSFDIYTIEQPDEILVRNIDITDVTCGADCDGEIEVNLTGGTLPYSFAWSNGGTDSVLTDLCAGTYTLTVTDANGCELITSATVGGPAPMVITLDSLADATCTNTGDGYIGVTVSGGTAPYSYQWIFEGSDTLNVQDLQGALAGTYVLNISDATGCMLSDTFEVDAIFFVEVTAQDDIEVCPASGVFLTGSNNGGTSARWLFANGTVAGSGTSLSVTTVSDTSMYVLEGINNVCVDRDTVFVYWTEGPGIDAGPDRFIEPGESVEIGGSPTARSGVDVVWTPATDISSIVALNPTVNPLQTTVYYVSATDEDECYGLDSVIVTVEEVVDPVGGFSPNGDGVNDFFVIDRIEDYPNAIVQIFNRWGNLIFESPAGYTTAWNGKYKGQELPVGTYYYVIDLKDDQIDRLITGPVTIMK